MKGMAYHGWKHSLPDKFWPVTLDNFFDNPDEIRELGLRMMESDKVVESRKKDSKRVSEILKTSMSEAAKLLVPLEVEIGSGKNWDQAH